MERILQAARGKERVTYKGVPIRLSADFSKETLQARKGWKEVHEFMKGNIHEIHENHETFIHEFMKPTCKITLSSNAII